MVQIDLPYDTTEQIGYRWLSIGRDHPFYEAAICHDREYDELIAGTSRLTLKQIDRRFLRNMLRAAACQNWLRSTNGAIDYIVEAYTFYRIARAWAKYVRPELENFVPTNPNT